MSKLVHIGHISDTCGDLQENLKITSAYVKNLERLDEVIIPVISLAPVKNSVDVGFNLSEAITNPEAASRLILVGNYAPPDLEKAEEGTKDNVRKSFYAAKLEFGGRVVTVVSTLNAYELSYIKPAVVELYEIKSDNGSQFRSLTLAPAKAVEFFDAKLRQGLIDSGAIKRVDLNEIPEVPDVSHVVHIDNFKNVKIWFSAADRELLQHVGQKRGKIELGFLPQSIDAHCQIDPKDPSINSLTAEPRKALFDPKVGEKVIALRSSSLYIDGSNVIQLAEVRKDPIGDPISFQLPHVGQRVQLHAAPR